MENYFYTKFSIKANKAKAQFYYQNLKKCFQKKKKRRVNSITKINLINSKEISLLYLILIIYHNFLF